jgi:hypothetical protein
MNNECKIIMAHNTSGITIERNALGIPHYARIDLFKYGAELKDFFASKGVEVEKTSYNPEFVAKIRKAEKQPSVKVDIDNLWK